ncbi:AUGMIN subunit 4 [Zea mays]|uniref:AUGMIN subunit 4 n=1 Tax=Zea mays TaxID=4577 RepID=A0A1D6GYS1_MAIZE|nr:AUGMIN subunit 4 [Zea mays]
MSKAAAASLPPPPPEVAHLVEQLQRHHLAPDASLLSSSAHSDLLQAREEVAAERALYLEIGVVVLMQLNLELVVFLTVFLGSLLIISTKCNKSSQPCLLTWLIIRELWLGRLKPG